MWIKSEEFQGLIQQAQNSAFLSQINVIKLTSEFFNETIGSLTGITCEDLVSLYSKVYSETIKDWDRKTPFEQFIKESYPTCDELQKLLILIGPDEE